MGQKVNPHGLRVGVIKNWDSRWYASDEKFGDILVSDYNLRKHLKNKLSCIYTLSHLFFLQQSREFEEAVR